MSEEKPKIKLLSELEKARARLQAMQPRTLRKSFLEGVFYVLRKHRGTAATKTQLAAIRADVLAHLRRLKVSGEIPGVPRFRLVFDERDPNRLLIEFEKVDCEKFNLYETQEIH